MSNIVIILIAAAVFVALIVWFTMDTKHVRKWTVIAFLIAIGGGLFIYGTIDAEQFRDMPLIAVLRIVVHVGKMFGNAGDGSHDSFVKIVGPNVFASAFYWMVHFFAYYSVVSALVLSIGKDIIKAFRTWLLRFRDIELIYGINDDTIKLAETLGKRRHISLVLVGKGKVSDSFINRTGALVYDDLDALEPYAAFLQRMSVKSGTGRIRVSALSDDEEANYNYAVRMIRCLKEAGVEPVNADLVMFARAVMVGNDLQALGDHYGYGSVKVYERSELAARLLMRKYPISDVITFDDKAKACKDVDVLMVGFGKIGQEVLRKVVAAGQFEGSNFHVQIFDPEYEKRNGFFCSRYPGIIDSYDIRFEAVDGRSCRFADYVKRKAGHLSLITVCVGNEEVGREITYGIIDILASQGMDTPVYQCYGDKIIRNHVKDENVTTSVFDSEIIYGTSLDALAKEINHFYYGEGSAEEQWKTCDYFSRMSCCASADYLQGLMRRLGLSKASPDVITGELMENLAKSEHLRWNAFHYSMGYQSMSAEERERRVELYKKDNSVRILKDVEHKIHGCLVTWDELDALSDFENAITGKNLDYKQMDRENVKAVCGIISRMEQQATN